MSSQQILLTKQKNYKSTVIEPSHEETKHPWEYKVKKHVNQPTEIIASIMIDSSGIAQHHLHCGISNEKPVCGGNADANGGDVIPSSSMDIYPSYHDIF